MNLESCWTGVLRCLLFPQRLLDVGKEEEQEEAAPPCRSLPQLCSIPRRLVISPGLGGAPVTPQLTEVRQRDGETKSKLTSYQLEGFSSCPSLSQSLRRILFGGTFHVFNYEWRKSVFQFRESDSEFSYALETDRVRHTCSFTTRHITTCSQTSSHSDRCHSAADVSDSLVFFYRTDSKTSHSLSSGVTMVTVFSVTMVTVFSLTWPGVCVFQGGTRPIQMVVQARVIKHLLFVRQSSSEGRTLQR